MADDTCSADTDDLDTFVENSDGLVAMMSDTHETLRSDRAGLANLPLPFTVANSELENYAILADFIAENGNFARDVSDALKMSGTRDGSLTRAPAFVIDAELEKSDAERLDEFESTLIDQGILPDEAAKIRAEIAAQLEDDPTMSFHDAVLAGTAEYQGITVDELEQRQRAFELYPADVGTVIDENFDLIASQTGDSDKITIEDLQLVIDDVSLPQDVRDAAFRLAADGILFNNMDVARQTNLTDEPIGNGFNWSKVDGEISESDAEQFNQKNYHAEILMAWHPLIETANQGYDLSKVDSHAGESDVLAFVSDPDIPLHVRAAVAEIYSSEYISLFGINVDLATELETAEGFAVGGTGLLDRPRVPTSPTAPRPTTPRPTAPRVPPAGGGGGGRGGGLAALVAVAALVGWEYGTQRRIERDGNPSIVYTNPQTGQETVVDPSEIEHLTPEEAKAWVAYFTTYGGPPSEPIDTIEPFAYLDVDGQWRMSDTNEPVEIQTFDPLPDGQFYDSEGRARYNSTGELVDAEPEPELATDGAGARQGGGGRQINPPPGDSDIWQGFENVGGGRRTNGLRGRAKQYYEWDYTHNDIEVYDHNGIHVGSMNPTTGDMYKDAVEGREIEL